MPNNFFKHNDKVYSENLNDGILVGNCFDVTLGISLPSDTGGVFPSTNDKVKAKVADVTPTQNSNLSIGDVITNNTGSSQEYRLTVYPNFNRFGGFERVNVTGDGCSVRITEKGESSAIVNNLNYNDLSNVSQLKRLKEYDIVVTIPAHKVCTGLNFVLVTTTNDGVAKINQNNVTGLQTALESKQEKLINGVNIKTLNNNDLLGSGNIQLLDSSIHDTTQIYGENLLQNDINNNLYEDIQTILEKLRIKEAHGTYYQAYKQANIVTVYMERQEYSPAKNTWVTLGNLPENFAPNKTIMLEYNQLRVLLNSQGAIQINTDHTPINIQFNMTFIRNE